MNDAGRLAMGDQELARLLGTLRYVDRTAVELYKVMMPRASEDAREALSDYLEDHERHATAFEQLCDSEGWEISDPSEETRALAEEYRRLAATAGDREAAMHVLLLAERTAAMLYAEADQREVPSEVADTISDHLADEALHVAYLEQNLPAMTSLIAMPLDDDENAVLCVTGGLTDDRSPDDFE